MAIVPIHKSITRTVLSGLGFGAGACDAAAEANARVDEKQGLAADETNLHAMRGYLPEGRMQTREEAEQAVARLVAQAKADVQQAIATSDFVRALKRLGEGHHTVQDREYHKFEPWPFTGIGNALFGASAGARYGLLPDYMLCHAVRDLSFVSGMNYGAGYNSARGWRGDYWLEISLPTASGPIPYLSFGSYGSAGIDGRPGEVAGYVMFTWGARPRSLRTSSSLPDSPDRLAAMPSRSFCQEVGEGLTAFELATARSREMVQQIHSATGDPWSGFVSGSG